MAKRDQTEWFWEGGKKYNKQCKLFLLCLNVIWILVLYVLNIFYLFHFLFSIFDWHIEEMWQRLTNSDIFTFIPFADDTPLFLRVEGTVPRWASVPSRLPWRFPCQDPLFTSLQTPVPKITSWPTKSCSSSSRNSHRFGYCRSKSYSVFGLYVKRSDLYPCVYVCRWCLCWQGTVMIGLTLATRLTKRSPPPAPGRSSI